MRAAKNRASCSQHIAGKRSHIPAVAPRLFCGGQGKDERAIIGRPLSHGGFPNGHVAFSEG
jgi:hypothetical protein